jgi:predicted O-methyltransferase YrrM
MGALKSLIKRIPFTGRLQWWYGNTMTELRGSGIVKVIASSPYSQGASIAKAISFIGKTPQGGEQEDINAIEAQRRKYAAIADPLVDGTLGDGGLYDQNVSVREAFGVSKQPKSAVFLYMLVRALKPKTVLELGTNTGISSAFIAAALKRNGFGKVVTLDASPYRQRLARGMHMDLGLDNVTYVTGLFTDTLDGVLHAMGEVDLAFIDGHHQYQPTLDYFGQIVPFVTEDAVFLFDDIRWSEGMLRAWTDLQRDQRTGLSVDLNTVGLTTLRKEGIPGTHKMDRLYYL